MPAAVKTVAGFVRAHIAPTRIANRIVKTIRIGSPNFLTVSRQHATTMDIAISKTDTTIMRGVEATTFLNHVEFIAQIQNRTVTIS